MDISYLFFSLADVDVRNAVLFQIIYVLAVFLIRTADLVAGLFGNQRQGADGRTADSRKIDMHEHSLSSASLTVHRGKVLKTALTVWTGHVNISDKTMPGKLNFLKHIPYWVFGILFVLAAALAIYEMRQNNQTMVELRGQVYEADKNGGDTEAALANLRSFVHSHMNTNLSSGGNAIKPPIQLKYTYERLQAAEQARVDAANSQIYTDAQNYCQAQNPGSFSGGPRVPCVEEYVTSHGASAKEIPAALYKFDFIGPIWSPDLAGWSLLSAAILFLAFAASFTMDRMVRSRIRNQQL